MDAAKSVNRGMKDAELIYQITDTALAQASDNHPTFKTVNTRLNHPD